MEHLRFERYPLHFISGEGPCHSQGCRFAPQVLSIDLLIMLVGVAVEMPLLPVIFERGEVLDPIALIQVGQFYAIPRNLPYVGLMNVSTHHISVALFGRQIDGNLFEIGNKPHSSLHPVFNFFGEGYATITQSSGEPIHPSIDEDQQVVAHRTEPTISSISCSNRTHRHEKTRLNLHPFAAAACS